jgi:hypothetical protein
MKEISPNMKGTIFMCSYILLIILMASFSSAMLGTFTQNEPVSIRVLANCSTINLTEVNDGNTTYIINSPMTHLGGQTFNYSFPNTSSIGTYSYSWNNPCVDCATNECGNSFKVTVTGKEVTQQQINLIIIGLVVLFVLAGFFFLLSYLFKHPGTKIFLMALSTITLIIIVGMVTSNATIYLSEYPTILSMYTTYYMFATYLAGACMLGIIGWLIYYSLQLFNKSRGVSFDD